MIDTIFFICFLAFLMGVMVWTIHKTSLDGIDLEATVVDIVKYGGEERCIIELNGEKIMTENKCTTAAGTDVYVQKWNGYNNYEILEVRTPSG